jgi:outer membrane protein assembly factor BamB
MAKFRHQFVLLIYTFVVLLFTSNVMAGMDTTATWTFKTGAAVYSSPMYDNGSVYIGSDDNNLYCLNAVSGSMKWKFETGGIIRCKPAIADTVVFFESDDGNLSAVNKNSGTKIWSLNIGNNITRVLPDPSTFTGNYWDYMQSSPCVDSGIVYAGSGDSSFYAVNAQTGKLKWKTKTGGIIRSSPCVYQGIVYVGSWDGYIYAFDKTDGTVIWKYNTQANGYQNVQSSPRVDNGIVYCGSRSGYFYALDAINGTLIWKYSYDPNAPWVESSATIVNGVVYVGSSDMNRVFALDDSTGKVIWKGIVQGDTWSSPFYYHGTLYIGLAHYSTSGNGNALFGGALLAIDASTGKSKWQFNCGSTSFIGGVVSSPSVNGHTIYYGSLDGKVYAVDTAFGQQVTGVKNSGELPKTFQLYNNYPNPFNPTTTIAYQVSVASRVTLKVYDSLGREVRTLVDEVNEPGGYEVKFDASNLSSGVYFNNLMSGLSRETKAMVLLK